jgi:hypothetical protein
VIVLTELKAFSCLNCGRPYPAVPPNDICIVAKSTPCPKDDSIPIQTDCKDCGHRNTIWWDKKHDEDEDRFKRIAGGV